MIRCDASVDTDAVNQSLTLRAFKQWWTQDRLAPGLQKGSKTLFEPKGVGKEQGTSPVFLFASINKTFTYL